MTYKRLKTPGANQKGLKKLPRRVRNKMGYKQKGGSYLDSALTPEEMKERKRIQKKGKSAFFQTLPDDTPEEAKVARRYPNGAPYDDDGPYQGESKNKKSKTMKQKGMGGEADEMQLGGQARRRRQAERRRRRASRKFARSMNKGNKGGKCKGPGCGAYAEKGGYLEESKEITFGAPSKKQAGGPNYPVFPKDSDKAKDFRKAYAAAKAAGKSTFMWDGRKYAVKAASSSSSESSAPARRSSGTPEAADTSGNSTADKISRGDTSGASSRTKSQKRRIERAQKKRVKGDQRSAKRDARQSERQDKRTQNKEIRQDVRGAKKAARQEERAKPRAQKRTEKLQGKMDKVANRAVGKQQKKATRTVARDARQDKRGDRQDARQGKRAGVKAARQSFRDDLRAAKGKEPRKKFLGGLAGAIGGAQDGGGLKGALKGAVGGGMLGRAFGAAKGLAGAIGQGGGLKGALQGAAQGAAGGAFGNSNPFGGGQEEMQRGGMRDRRRARRAKRATQKAQKRTERSLSRKAKRATRRRSNATYS